MNANYIGILVWAIGLGFALRHGNETTKNLVNDVSNAVTFMVKIVIRFAGPSAAVRSPTARQNRWLPA